VTPDDFPTREKYLEYVKECEESIEFYDYAGYKTDYTFYTATDRDSPTRIHLKSCQDKEDPYCWCVGDDDGLIYYWARGVTLAGHATSPPFTFKFDNHFNPEECGWCRPENFVFLLPERGAKKISPEEGEKNFWSNMYVRWERAREEYDAPEDPELEKAPHP
jgi:hypothetical protein